MDSTSSSPYFLASLTPSRTPSPQEFTNAPKTSLHPLNRISLKPTALPKFQQIIKTMSSQEKHFILNSKEIINGETVWIPIKEIKNRLFTACLNGNLTPFFQALFIIRPQDPLFTQKTSFDTSSALRVFLLTLNICKDLSREQLLETEHAFSKIPNFSDDQRLEFYVALFSHSALKNLDSNETIVFSKEFKEAKKTIIEEAYLKSKEVKTNSNPDLSSRENLFNSCLTRNTQSFSDSLSEIRPGLLPYIQKAPFPTSLLNSFQITLNTCKSLSKESLLELAKSFSTIPEFSDTHLLELYYTLFSHPTLKNLDLDGFYAFSEHFEESKKALAKEAYLKSKEPTTYLPRQWGSVEQLTEKLFDDCINQELVSFNQTIRRLNPSLFDSEQKTSFHSLDSFLITLNYCSKFSKENLLNLGKRFSLLEGISSKQAFSFYSALFEKPAFKDFDFNEFSIFSKDLETSKRTSAQGAFLFLSCLKRDARSFIQSLPLIEIQFLNSLDKIPFPLIFSLTIRLCADLSTENLLTLEKHFFSLKDLTEEDIFNFYLELFSHNAIENLDVNNFHEFYKKLIYPSGSIKAYNYILERKQKKLFTACINGDLKAFKKILPTLSSENDSRIDPEDTFLMTLDLCPSLSIEDLTALEKEFSTLEGLEEHLIIQFYSSIFSYPSFLKLSREESANLCSQLHKPWEDLILIAYESETF